MKRYRVLLSEGEGDEYVAFESYFDADDIEHAQEQAEDAYPEAKVEIIEGAP